MLQLQGVSSPNCCGWKPQPLESNPNIVNRLAYAQPLAERGVAWAIVDLGERHWFRLQHKRKHSNRLPDRKFRLIGQLSCTIGGELEFGEF